MARIRSIKPEFFTSEAVSALPFRARLTWIGLWTHCDNHGRARDNVKLIKAAIWPLDDVGLKEVEEDLATLANHGRIVRYIVGGKRYLLVTNWGEHQYGAGKGEPKFPGLDEADVEPTPDLTQARLKKSGRNPDASRPDQDSPALNQGSGGHDGKIAPSHAPKRTRDELFDAVAAECGIDPGTLTESGRGPINRALKELRAVEATPNQVKVRAARYRRRFADAALTPSALAKHWAALGDQAEPSAARPSVAEMLRPAGAEW